jgi:leucyl-tRNA synthetase
MIYLNEIQKQEKPAKTDVETLLLLLNPFAPHLTEELWSRLGHKDMLCRQTWPPWDEAKLAEKTVEYAVQVNGKVRATFSFEFGSAEEVVKSAALGHEKVKPLVDGKTVVKMIVVPNKLVNIVVK